MAPFHTKALLAATGKLLTNAQSTFVKALRCTIYPATQMVRSNTIARPRATPDMVKLHRSHRHANQPPQRWDLFLHQRPLPRHRKCKSFRPLQKPIKNPPKNWKTDAMKKWRDGVPQGWLARDHPAWFQSTQRLKRLESTTKGRIVPGHDKETFLQLQGEKSVFS